MLKPLLVLILCFQFTPNQAQNNLVFCKQTTAIQRLITASHYSPKPVNDSLSNGVFELFINQLDENKRYFHQSDIAAFEVDRYNIDDFLLSNSCDFILKYSQKLKERLEFSKQIIENLKNETFDYSGKDTLYFKPDNKHEFFKDETKAKIYWNKRIRYLIISKLIEEDSIFDNIHNHFKAREASIKPKVIENQLCLLEEALHQKGNLDIHVQETFLNALMNYQDPNSSFFNDSDKMEFESSVANDQLSFGIATSKNSDGEIVIAYITPGSAAFKNGDLEPNDVLQSLSTGKKLLETYCVSNEDISAFINNEKHHTITFKIKKTDGSVKDIELTKTRTQIENNSVRGYVLQNDMDFGYIKIPSFYTDLESPNGLGLANDVAKELYKLNQENIKGLIIDLRFNGGGSMKEAAELSGMFIDRGPLSIIKYPNGETFTIRDMNRGLLFPKPMVVLINNYSASASELFASVMQDYNRAVIVGSPSHGKSSAQTILPLSESEDLGFCKITVEKFYRITGLSHQSVGVLPDVLLPSIYDNFGTNEGFEKYALQPDSVETTMNYNRFKSIPFKYINAKSKSRVENHPSFGAIKQTNTIVLNDYILKDSEYPLTLQDIYNDLKGYHTLWSDFYAQLDEQSTNLLARNTSSTNEILQYNEDDKFANQLMLQDIVDDIYIEEAHTILLDLLNFKNN